MVSSSPPSYSSLSCLQELLALQQLGFSHADSMAAIRSTSGDVDAAAELLLMSGAGGSTLCVEEPLQAF